MNVKRLSIDIAMPTYQSEPVLGKTLDHLAQSEKGGPIDINYIYIIDNNSDDGTLSIAETKANEYGWKRNFISQECSLPDARQLAIDCIDTDWFLFLDDDVRITESYLRDQASAIAPSIGAVQGRKSIQTTVAAANTVHSNGSSERHPSEWVHHRAFRGGTHATLIRHEAAESVEFPPDLDVWEDQYLRREIEANGYLWLFNHQARFAHVTQNPRPQGWNEGYVQGKYGLRPAWHVTMGIPYACFSDSSSIAAAKQVAGYFTGRAAERISATLESRRYRQ